MHLTLSIRNTTLRKIVRRQFDADAISRNDTNKVFSHFSGHMCNDCWAIIQLDSKTSVSERLCYGAFDLKRLFFFPHAKLQIGNEQAFHDWLCAHYGRIETPDNRIISVSER